MGAVAEVRIRPEVPDDFEVVTGLVAAAFRSEAHGRLVEAIRTSSGYIPELALVAECDDDVAGYVMISLVALRTPDRSELRIPSLSPLAVDPARQGKGVGSALVRAVTAAAERRGEALVVLEGDPRYYGRFGFEPAARYDIRMDLPSWAPPEAAQVLVLRPDGRVPVGRVVYPAAFDLVAED